MIENHDDEIVFEHDGRQLLTYVRCPERTGSPMTARYPYVHPLRTYGGREVTEVKPEGHPYLHGLFVAGQNVAESNFWAPATYLPERGYVVREDRGDIYSQQVEHVEHDGLLGIREQLRWESSDGAVLLEEERTIAVEQVEPEKSSWVLRFGYALTNVTDHTIHFATPGSDGRRHDDGRPGWGYTGLFWRGPISMRGGAIIGPETDGELALDGESTAWLGFVGPAADGQPCTLVFIDDPVNHTSWYANSNEYPGIGFGIAARQRKYLDPGHTLARNHRIIIADGAWDRDQIHATVSS